MLKAILAATLFTLTSQAPLAAQEQTPITVSALKRMGDAFIIEVPYRDLDLSRIEGVAALRHRVDAAAHTGCSTKQFEPALTDNERRGCIDDAVGGAIPQMQRAKRRAIEIARSGHSSIPPVAIAMRIGF